MPEFVQFLVWREDGWQLVAMFRDYMACEAVAGLVRQAWQVAVACAAS